MMKTNLISAFLLIFSAILLSACGGNTANNANRTTMNTTVNTTTTNSTSTNSMMNNSTVSNTNTANSNVAVMQDNFWVNAAQSGMAEVEIGKLAAQKATNAEVKKFAQMMVADHTKANEELKTLAAKNNVKLPTEMDSSHKSMLEKLQGLTGAEFDKAYVEGQVDDHETAVDLMEDNTGNSNADIKAFAAKSLPIMKSHLDMIKGIQGKMK
jgi:putative membrane protein